MLRAACALPEVQSPERPVRVPKVQLPPLTPEEPTLASPVSVFHVCCRAEGLRAPSRSQHARTMRSEASAILLNAYCELVSGHRSKWMATDMAETEARRSASYAEVVVRSPEQDALGVVACANAVMRYVLDDDYLLEHNIDAEVRYWLAAILFSVYKMKSESFWEPGKCMDMLVLEMFLFTHELGDWRASYVLRKQHSLRLWAIEAKLLIDYPFGKLVDTGVHGTCETALAQLLEAGAITERHATLGIGIVHFYLHATHVNAKRDVLEELGVDRSMAELGAALAYIVLVSVRLHEHRVDTALDLDVVSGAWHYDRQMLTHAALELVSNANLVAKRHRLDGAYSRHEAYAYAYVSPDMLHMLLNTLSDSVLA